MKDDIEAVYELMKWLPSPTSGFAMSRARSIRIGPGSASPTICIANIKQELFERSAKHS